MKLRAKIYAGLVICAGVAVGVWACVGFFRSMSSLPWENGWDKLFGMLVLSVICRSFPIYMRDDQALDVSIVMFLAIYLTVGVEAAIVIVIVGALFVTDRGVDGGRRVTVFTTPPVKTLFNNATISLSIFVSDRICRFFPDMMGVIQLPQILVPVLIFSVCAFFTNGVMALMLFYLNGEIPLAGIFPTLWKLMPNVLATMPIALIIVMLLTVPNGGWLVLLMLLPLMLARYAWKLYLDSQKQRERLINAFVYSMEARDVYTQGHSRRVAEYSVQIARQMKLPRRQIATISEGAILHDIGKIGIDDAILRKPGRLTDEEFALIRRHPVIGTEIVQPVGMKKEIVEMIRWHHERLDGGGYPDGLRGEAIPFNARLLTVADAYDAMTSDRPYRKGMSAEEARTILQLCAGTQFDPAIVAAFLASQPASGTLGMQTEAHS